MSMTEHQASVDPGAAAAGPCPGLIVFIDAECSFCNNSAAFMLRHDPHERIHIAALQGETAARLLPQHGIDSAYVKLMRTDNASIDSILCLVDGGTPQARIYERSRAGRMIARRMGFPYRFLGWISWWIPDALLDPVYMLVKRNRHRIASTACALPAPALRKRYLD
jgi:predicted DCC family thiol-disulfide oxidoreductase YuxK